MVEPFFEDNSCVEKCILHDNRNRSVQLRLDCGEDLEHQKRAGLYPKKVNGLFGGFLKALSTIFFLNRAKRSSILYTIG